MLCIRSFGLRYLLLSGFVLLTTSFFLSGCSDGKNNSVAGSIGPKRNFSTSVPASFQKHRTGLNIVAELLIDGGAPIPLTVDLENNIVTGPRIEGLAPGLHTLIINYYLDGILIATATTNAEVVVGQTTKISPVSFQINEDLDGDSIIGIEEVLSNSNPNDGNSQPPFLFAFDDGVNGTELWKSDGTGAGTVFVKDIKAVTGSSSPSGFTYVNGVFFFQADDGFSGIELWKSDGTAAGTVLVKDTNGQNDRSPDDFTNVNGTLFFSADDGSNGFELWKSDGTTTGTTLVKDIDLSDNSSSIPRDLTDVNGTLFFRANGGMIGDELWKSDGTAAGTVLVKDINPGANFAFPDDLTDVNGTLFFSADDGMSGRELWKSDGTAEGTTLVKDIGAGINSFPSNLTNVNGTLFFSAGDDISGDELWKSDGTATGTTLVKDINNSDAHSFPSDLTSVNGTLFF